MLPTILIDQDCERYYFHESEVSFRWIQLHNVEKGYRIIPLKHISNILFFTRQLKLFNKSSTIIFQLSYALIHMYV